MTFSEETDVKEKNMTSFKDIYQADVQRSKAEWGGIYEYGISYLENHKIPQ